VQLNVKFAIQTKDMKAQSLIFGLREEMYKLQLQHYEDSQAHRDDIFKLQLQHNEEISQLKLNHSDELSKFKLQNSEESNKQRQSSSAH